MRIAVCDDERTFREEIKNAIYSYSALHRLELVVDEFESGEALLKVEYDYEVIFLDYKMGGIDGLAAARELRNNGIDTALIFLTSYPDFMQKAFEVRAFRFLKKPLDNAEVHNALDSYFWELRENCTILLKKGHETKSVKSNDIVYLQADNKKCYVHLVDKELHLARTMASIERVLPMNGFIKVHKKFIVNFRHIDKYSNEFVYFKTAEPVPISRNSLSAFKNAFLIYTKNRTP